MTASDYPVTFGYGGIDGVYYTATKPHRGCDRSTPEGTPIVIEGVTIGLTGNTGLTSGPHLHTQAASDKSCQLTLDPALYEFKGGTVLTTGNASQWGNFIIIEVEPGKRYVCYAHLSKIMVTQGQLIGGSNEMTDENFVRAFFIDLFSTEPTKEQIAQYVNRPWKEVYSELRSAPPHQELVTYYRQVVIDNDNRAKRITELADQLRDAVTDSGAADKLQQIKEIVNQ